MAVVLGMPPVAATAAVPTSATWWKVDAHEHSAFSGDARADLGVVSKRAQAGGYNAVFLTDHDRAASFQISGANGNILTYTEDIAITDPVEKTSRWNPKTTGSLSSSTTATSTVQVHSGSKALRVQASSASSGRAMVYATRGPSLRAGAVTLDFWIYPQSISAGSGADVSVALGGDTTTLVSPFGYTNAAGTTNLGQSSVLVWQLGSARTSTQSGSTHVYTNQLSYTPQVWNHYSIDVRSGAIDWTAGGATQSSAGTGLDTLAPADRPADYAVLSYPKMEAVANNGTADVYFDDYSLQDAQPNCPAADFVYRNSLIGSGAFDGPGFKIFPAREMGQNNHSNQFNFGISNPADYEDTYADTSLPAGYRDDGALCASTNTTTAPWTFSRLGTDNIADIQASGYPAQDNHPGVTDTTATIISTKAHGADNVEVRTGADYSSTWDAILQQNHIIVGTYGSDSHEGVGSTNPSNFIDAPSLTLDDLMHAYFEGRMYLAPGNFSGRIVLNTDGSPRPYPARYATMVSDAATSATVNLAVSGGLSSGQAIRWVTNSGAGTTTTDVPVSGASYSETRTVPLFGAFTYVRAEVRDSAGKLLSNTEPIFFRAVAGLPADKSIRVDAVTPADGCSCNSTMTKGITSTSWGAGGLAVRLTNPAGSTVNLRGTSDDEPTAVTMDGARVPESSDLASFQGSSGNAWFFDPGTKQLYLQDQQDASASFLTVSFGDQGSDNPPSVPVNFTGVVGSTTTDLSWSPSIDTDTTPVAGYHVFRGTTLVGDVTSGTTFQDTGLTPQTAYTYRVSAYDVAGLESAKSDPVQLTTTVATVPLSGTFTASADTYVVDGDSTSHGLSTLLKVDSTPTTNNYLRFHLSNLSGSSVQSAQLKVYTSSALAAGFSVRSTSGSWDESTTFATAPPASGATLASGGTTANAYQTVDVTSLVTSTSGDVNLVLLGRSGTNLAIQSREGANKPQLVVTTQNGPADQAPSVPTNVAATATGPTAVNLSWQASTDTDATGVAGYHVFRDGAQVADVTTGTTYSDQAATAGNTYSYAVTAYDTAGNESGQSAAASVTTPTGGSSSGTFNAVADAYVAAGDTVNHGTTTALRTDTSPKTDSYLRFQLSGLSGTHVDSAQLKVYTTNALTAGFEVRSTSGGWTETGILATNAPGYSATGPSSGPVSAGAYVTVDVTSLVTSTSGEVDLVLTGLSTTNLSINSREAVNKPQLVLQTS